MQYAQQSLNIAIFGLSLKVLNEIKLLIERLTPRNTLITWTNIADPKLQVLMVNDMFFDAPNIQKLIKNQNIKLLRLVNSAAKQGQIENNILYLPLSDTHSLESWLTEEPVTPKAQPSYSSNHQTAISDQDLLAITHQILHPENGIIQVFDQKGVFAIVDCKNQWVWVSDEKAEYQTDGSLNTVYATMHDRQAFNAIQRQDLRNWLWNVLWRSPSFHHLVKDQDCFYLKQWPQPESKQDRYEIMRMSACFALGANITTVAERLGLSVDRVIQFVSAAHATGMGSIIPKNQVKYPVQQYSEEDTGLMRKFFGKLRRRLGF